MNNLDTVLSVYFGVPGSGKTTFSAYLAKKSMKRGFPVYSNCNIKGAYRINPTEDLGVYNIENAHVIIDEAGIEYNSRKFKTFSDTSRYFFKYFRHYGCQVDVFSQGYDDMDKTIRILAQNLYVVRKSYIPYFICRKRIKKYVGINDLTHQIEDAFKFQPLGKKLIFSPPLWKMFDTLEHKELPSKVFEKWSELDTPKLGASLSSIFPDSGNGIGCKLKKLVRHKR